MSRERAPEKGKAERGETERRGRQPLDRPSLTAMRAALRDVEEGQRRGIVALVEASAGRRVVVDFDARADLGHPLVVVEGLPPRPSWWEALSTREREVALLVAEGRSNGEIGAALFIAVATVKDHVHHVLTKAGVSRRGQVAAALRP